MNEIGVDIGGTFTDVVLLRDHVTLHHTKVPTTPEDPIAGVLNGVETILGEAGLKPGDVSRIVHGSTVAINALLERKGAVTGILMTRGFEDTLEIGRQKRSQLYNLYPEPETPTFLAPRHRRIGVTERMAADGSVVTPLQEGDVRDAVNTLVQKHGVSAVAVCYLFSFANPDHEIRTRQLIEREFEGIEVSISSDVDPTFREYERLVVTTLDAYLRGAVRGYVRRLSEALETMGFDCELHVMQSRGGVTVAESIAEHPVRLLLSGLAAGVVGAQFTGNRVGEDNLVSLDIGGTSCDVALIRNGKPLVSNMTSIARLPLRQQMIDLNTIGAGGGSVAWLDDVGGLRVGPHSMGSDPGPACYGRGGTEATVTDASLVLGYLNPESFAAGSMRLDLAAAEKAIGKLAKRLNLEPAAAASGIHRILNARMADEIRKVSVQKGHDPRRFAMVALGGAGPVHAGALAAELGISRVIVPETPGVLSAFGLLVGDIEHDQSETFAFPADALDRRVFDEARARLKRRCTGMMEREGVPLVDVLVHEFADMRYVGQSYELTIDLPVGSADPVGAAVTAFHAYHQSLYGHSEPSAPVEFVNLRSVHVYPLPAPKEVRLSRVDGANAPPARSRPVFFDSSGGYVETKIFDRRRLERGETIKGPAIIEQPDTTVVVYPRHKAYIHETGNIILELSDGRGST